MKIIPISIKKSELRTKNLVAGQLLYCDTTEAFFDYDETTRMQLNNTRQLDNDLTRTSLENPEENLIYIVVSTNELYRYANSTWIKVEDSSQCSDLFFNSLNLKPGTLMEGSTRRAVKTLTSQVYNPDGSTLADTIDQLMKQGMKITLEQKVACIVITYDGQRVLNVPYPTSNYDIQRFPITVIYNDTFLNPSEYAIGKEQMILSQDIPTFKGDIITLFFCYCTTTPAYGVNADYIDNHKVYYGDIQPNNPPDQAIWFDYINGKIWRYAADDNRWYISIDNNYLTVRKVTSTKTIDKPTNYVEIGVDRYNKFRDMLMVFQDSVLLTEGEDYVVSGDSTGISCLSGDRWIPNEPIKFTFIVLYNVADVDYTDEDSISSVMNTQNVLDTLAELKKEIDEFKDMKDNDSVTKLQAQVNDLISQVNVLKNNTEFDTEVVNTLPEHNISSNKIYLVPNPNSTDDTNKYTEYMYINNKWEILGEGSASNSSSTN